MGNHLYHVPSKASMEFPFNPPIHTLRRIPSEKPQQGYIYARPTFGCEADVRQPSGFDAALQNPNGVSHISPVVATKELPWVNRFQEHPNPESSCDGALPWCPVPSGFKFFPPSFALTLFV